MEGSLPPLLPKSHWTVTHGTIPSEGNPEMSWASLTHWSTKSTHIKLSRKGLGTFLAQVMPTHCTAQYNQEGISKYQLFFERRFWMPHLQPQLLRLSSEGLALKTPGSESQWDLCPHALQGYSKQRQLLMGTGILTAAVTSGPADGEQEKDTY